MYLWGPDGICTPFFSQKDKQEVEEDNNRGASPVTGAAGTLFLDGLFVALSAIGAQVW